MMNISIFITTLVTSLTSTVFYEAPAKINSRILLEKKEKKVNYVIGITAFDDKSFFTITK